MSDGALAASDCQRISVFGQRATQTVLHLETETRLRKTDKNGTRSREGEGWRDFVHWTVSHINLDVVPHLISVGDEVNTELTKPRRSQTVRCLAMTMVLARYCQDICLRAEGESDGAPSSNRNTTEKNRQGQYTILRRRGLDRF